VRAEAASTAAALGDVAAIDALLDWWKEDPAARADAPRTLLERLAAEGADRDSSIDGALQGMGGLSGTWDPAVEIARKLAEAHPRFGLTVALAGTLHGRASRSEGRTKDQQTRDLEEADRLLESALKTGPLPVREGAIRLHVLVLEDLAALLPPGEARNLVLLRGVERAAGGGSRLTAEAGIRLASSLDGSPLPEDQRQRLSAARQTLDTLLRSRG
jgi:hypothetical protein